MAGRGNAAADAPSLFALMATGGDPDSKREPLCRIRVQVEARRGHMKVDMMARYDGANA